MIRTWLLKIIMWAIVPISLTFIFFFVTNDSNRSEAWVNLLFVWLAFFSASGACISSVKKLAVLDWTVYISAVGYFVIEMLLAFVFLCIYTDVPQWAFATQMLLFIAFVLLYCLLFISNQKTKEQIESQQSEINIIKQWKMKVNLAKEHNPSEELLQLLALLNVSPSKSIDEVKKIEAEISLLMENLPNELDKIVKKIKERNIILKTNY